MSAYTGIEYTQGSCDYWELHHLCNHMAGHGWTPVQVIPIPADSVRLPEKVSDDNSPLRKTPALFPYQVLFSRPTPTDETDQEQP